MTTENRYSHGKIYKLIDNTTGMFYIGSTALKRLDQRFNYHKSASWDPKKKDLKIYQHFTHDKLCSGDVCIILLEQINVSNKKELQKIENDYIQKELNNVLCVNTFRSFLSDGEKVLIAHDYHKKYREENRDELNKKRIQYIQQNKEKIQEYERKRSCNEERRQYNINKSREFRQKTYTCDCGSSFKMDTKSKHFKTKKHLNFINSQNSNNSELN